MATSIQVDKFATPHGKGEGGGGGTTIVMGGKNNSVPANLNVNTINATTGNIQNLTGRSMTFNDASFIYLVSENGTISKLNGNDLKYENGSIKSITSDSIDTGKLKTTDLEATNATIDNIISKNITTEYLTVTKQAHFFELIIDKIKSVGGQIILTPASCIADYVIPDPDHATPLYYDVYFRATDEVNREISNDWQVDDQAICQNFNNAVTGHSYNVSNKYYWRLVTGILDDVYINFRTGQKLPYNTSDAHDYTSANIWNICLGSNDVNTGNHIDYKTDFSDDPYYPEDPSTEGYTKRSLLDNIDIAPMQLNGLSMAGWEDKTEDEDPMIGEMRTRNTIFGIQITPKEVSNLSGAILNKIELSTAEATRLNIGVYYVDGSSQYFPAPLQGTRHYDYELNANTNVEAIIITNSDEPDWHLCHGIQLGNDNSDSNDPQVDVNYNPYSATVPSIPEAGDNIIQLGYRYNKYSQGDAEYDVKRASAIIIASYHTPDTGINPPSYAQYKKITDFNLTSHRHTYFDADGSKFYGNFYVGPDNSDPEDYVPISDLEAEVYKIVPSYDIITKDVNDVITPSTLTCSFMVPNQSELVNVVPTGCVFNYWKDSGAVQTIAAGQAVSITISDLTDKLILQLAKLTGDSGQQGPQGSQGVQTQKILDQILKQVVEIDVANGEPGLNGGFTEWVYRNGVNGNNLPTDAVPFTELDNGWSKTATTPQDGQFTWCTTRDNIYVMSNNVQSLQYGNWKPAYRITGNNGKNGEDGDPGTAGKDGKYIEYIYKHFTTEQTFGDNNYNPAYWDPIDDLDHYAYGWGDHPQGLGTIDNVFYEFEYMSQREFDGEHFGTFTEPVIWSRWGQNGQDGDGYEYVYTLSDEDPDSPNNISYGEIEPEGVANGNVTNKNQDEWVPNGWTDEPQGVSSTAGETKEWVSMRKRTNGNWGTFSDPALWAQYVPKGTNGGRYYFLYANYGSSGSRPSIIPNGSAKYSVQTLINAGWSLSVSTPDYANNKYTYMTQAFFNDGDTTSTWSVPARITGDNGKDGEDGSPGTAGANGKYIEFIYKHFTSKQSFYQNNNNPAYWDETDDPEYTGPTNYKWTDNPTGVNEVYRYEYMSQREYDGTSFGKFSTPVIWSAFGEKGKDGDGFEYIYKRFTTAQTFGADSRNPAWWGASTDDEYLGPSGYEWSDDPVELTSTYKWEYMSYRKKENGTWSTYNNPILWLRYATDGAEGPQGPQGSAGRNGTNGTNGTSPIEYKLVDLGSTANVQMSLNENTNEINQKMTVKLTFRVLRCEGSTSRYMYGNEFSNMRVYYRMSQQSAGTSYYYRLLTLNSTSSSTIAQFTVNYETTYDRIIQDNPNIIVSLVNSTTGTISDTQITSYTVYDTTNISTTLESGAAINVVQSDVNNVASIRSLVTGPQGISTIWQTMNSINSRVSSVENDYVSEAELDITADQIKSEVISEVSDQFVSVFETMIDLTSLDTTRWYPVSITLKTNTGERQHIIVDRMLDSSIYGPKPNYGYHSAGFVCVADWSTMWSGWGVVWSMDTSDTENGGSAYTDWCKNECNGYDTDTYRFINNFDIKWTQSYNGIPSNYILGSIRNNSMTNVEIIYLRGGSKYRVRTEWEGTTVTVHPTGYYWQKIEGSITYSRSAPVITSYSKLILPEIDQMKRSEIVQTSDSITMRVNDVNTRLDNGGFTINANTTINGQLTINNSSEQGFIVTGDNGNTSILSKSIGTYNGFKNTATKWILANGSTNHAYWSTSSHSYTTSSNISLGNVKSGTVLRFKSFSCSAHKSNSGDNYAVGSWSGTIQIYNGSSLVKTISNITSSTGEQSYTTSSEGTYSLKLSWSINSLTIGGQSVSSATIDTSFAMYTFIPSGTYTLIGYDGIASNFGNDNTVFFGNEGTYIRYTDDNVLRVSANGIEKYCNGTTGGGNDYYVSNWSPINGCCVRKIGTSGTYNLKKFEDMIVVNITSGTAYIYLGTPGNNKGRRIYVKKMRGGCRVYGHVSGGSGNNIIPDDGDYDDYTQYRDQNEKMRIYISDGTYWYEGYF